MKKRRRRVLPRAEINVTPFIDILLVLLVIFMTISPTTMTGIDAEIPQQSPARSRQEPETMIVLSMDRNGVIRINQNVIDPAHLGLKLREIFKSRRERTIFIQGDDDLLFNDVAQLIDAANGAGAERIGMMTERIRVR